MNAYEKTMAVLGGMDVSRYVEDALASVQGGERMCRAVGVAAGCLHSALVSERGSDSLDLEAVIDHVSYLVDQRLGGNQ